MSFLYLFDLIDFDKDGQVCAVSNARENVSLGQARSNYLYLISKYNQLLMQEDGAKIPEFFKEELSDMLKDVEAGRDFQEAKEKVLANCTTKVKAMAEGSSDRELVEKLNAKVSIKDEELAKRTSKKVNSLNLAYIITLISGKVLDKTAGEKEIFLQSTNEEEKGKLKSKLYKNVIKYNNLVHTVEKVRSGELTQEEKAFYNVV